MAAAKKSLSGRLTAKVGPLPVWAWAVVLLLGGYLVYRLRAGSSASTTPAASTDTSGTPLDTTGSQDSSGGVGSGSSGSSGAGTPADTSQLSAELGTALTGFSSQLDTLTQAVQASPAFAGGSGGYSGDPYADYAQPYPNPPIQPGGVLRASRPAPARPAYRPPARHTPVPARPQPVHYYTFRPGHASSGRRQAAPAPHGRTLHYKKGKGYYYA